MTDPVLKALVIDDDKRLTDPISECLTAKGIEVKVASDSIMGIQIARQYQPNFILLDLMLPAGGGTVVLESLQNSEALKKIPIIVMTGSQDPVLKKKLLDHGIKTYLQKPISVQELLNAIANLFSPPETPQSSKTGV
jgi:DNA-binding response OmpR family regulator